MKAALLALALLACTDAESTRRVLSDEGYTNINITGYEAFSCSKNDTSCTGFVATHPMSGRRIKGVVGCGVTGGGCSKACTVRVVP